MKYFREIFDDWLTNGQAVILLDGLLRTYCGIIKYSGTKSGAPRLAEGRHRQLAD